MARIGELIEIVEVELPEEDRSPRVAEGTEESGVEPEADVEVETGARAGGSARPA